MICLLAHLFAVDLFLFWFDLYLTENDDIKFNIRQSILFWAVCNAYRYKGELTDMIAFMNVVFA